jgi:hypothetical protein
MNADPQPWFVSTHACIAYDVLKTVEIYGTRGPEGRESQDFVVAIHSGFGFASYSYFSLNQACMVLI